MDVEVQKDVETISPYGDTQINTGFSETIPSGSG